MSRRDQHFLLVFWIVAQSNLQRIQHTHGAASIVIQIFTNKVLKLSDINNAIGFGNGQTIAKFAHRCRRHTATTKPGNRWHTRVIPAVHMPFIDQLLKLALAGHGVIQIQATKLILAGNRRQWQIAGKPLIERSISGKLQSTDRMGHPFDGIFLAMSKIIGRIDIPLITGAMVWNLLDTIDHRITHIDIRRVHINFRPQCHGPFINGANFHLLKQLKALRSRSLTKWTVLTHLGECAAILAHLLGVQLADIGFAIGN